MESKTILIGVLIGVIVGGASVYTLTPRIDPAEYQSQREDPEATISSLLAQNDESQSQISALQNQISSLQSSLEAKETELDRAGGPDGLCDGGWARR